jgi:hypothetical protein
MQAHRHQPKDQQILNSPVHASVLEAGYLLSLYKTPTYKLEMFKIKTILSIIWQD